MKNFLRKYVINTEYEMTENDKMSLFEIGIVLFTILTISVVMFAKNDYIKQREIEQKKLYVGAKKCRIEYMITGTNENQYVCNFGKKMKYEKIIINESEIHYPYIRKPIYIAKNGTVIN